MHFVSYDGHPIKLSPIVGESIININGCFVDEKKEKRPARKKE